MSAQKLWYSGIRIDFHHLLQVRRREVGEVHGTVNAHAESQQRDHLDNQALAVAFETEEEEDDGYDDV